MPKIPVLVAAEFDPNVCRGLFKPCSNPVTHHMDDPDGKDKPIPLCEEHWNWAVALEKALVDSPEFKSKFEKALDKVSRPSRYERKPVI